MPELAAVALSALSYLALHATSAARPAPAKVVDPPRRLAGRAASAALFAAAAAVASDDPVLGVLVASLAWMLAASVVPVGLALAPGARPMVAAVAAVLALVALAWRAVDA